MIKGVTTCVVIFVLICQDYIIFAANPTDITRLRENLLGGYDKNVGPFMPDANGTVVTFEPYLRGFEFAWIDGRLKWDPESYANLTRVHFAAHEVWQPEILIYNNVGRSVIDHFGNTRIVASSSGAISWIPPTRFQVGCEQSDLREWPFDVHNCGTLIGLYGHDRRNMAFRIPVNMSEVCEYGYDGITVHDYTNVPNREFELLSTEILRGAYIYNEIKYTYIKLSVKFKRRSATHMCAVRTPALAISAAILISFWLRPGASERLILIFLVIIVNAVYINNIFVQILTHGDRVPYVLLFYRDSLIMAIIALVWTICLRYLASTRRTSLVPLPEFVKRFLNSSPAKILCLDARPLTIPDGTTEITDEGNLVGNENLHQADWAWLAHLLDRIVFLFYSITYIIFYAAMF